MCFSGNPNNNLYCYGGLYAGWRLRTSETIDDRWEEKILPDYCEIRNVMKKFILGLLEFLAWVAGTLLVLFVVGFIIAFFLIALMNGVFVFW